jgi:hypothetical protein
MSVLHNHWNLANYLHYNKSYTVEPLTPRLGLPDFGLSGHFLEAKIDKYFPRLTEGKFVHWSPWLKCSHSLLVCLHFCDITCLDRATGQLNSCWSHVIQKVERLFAFKKKSLAENYTPSQSRQVIGTITNQMLSKVFGSFTARLRSACWEMVPTCKTLPLSNVSVT